ncbi:hypothetical protein PQX77_015752 [Marasmius sp. AFHP31]|nr:hypothetical protein PQX77_015752 [Marasmius sp. AFHP31]
MSANPNRSRQNARKRGHDDASYISTNAGHHKKQHNQPGVAATMEDATRGAKRKRMDTDIDPNFLDQARISLIDFPSLPAPFIHRYLNHFDLVPAIRPLPITAEVPPPPYTLLNPHQYYVPDSPSRQPSPTPANRPRRNLATRSTSTPTGQIPLPTRAPILADVAELNVVLAKLVENHFRTAYGGGGDGGHSGVNISGREEVDTLAAFMCAVENGQRAPGMARRR